MVKPPPGVAGGRVGLLPHPAKSMSEATTVIDAVRTIKRSALVNPQLVQRVFKQIETLEGAHG